MYRIHIFSVTTILLLSACSLTSMPVTPLSGSLPTTQTPMAQPASQTGPFGQLEVISPQNWDRLQLLQSFPVEMLQNPMEASITSDEKTLVIGSRQRAQLFLFDLKSAKIFRLLEISGVKNIDARFEELKCLSDGSIMAKSSGPYMVYRIDRNTGDVLSAWESINFAISADEQIMAVDSLPGTLLINIADNTTFALLENNDSIGYSLSPDHTKIAMDAVDVSADAGRVDIWDIKSQTIIQTLPDTYGVLYSPNGKFLIGNSQVDGSLKIFSADGAALIKTISEAHSNALISSDGSLIAYQTPNGTSVAMDTTDWKSHETILQGWLDSFSPEGHMLVTRTEDGGVLIWGVPAGTE
jgi:WD40 repeat protein